ncbi:AAA family ATPase [Cryptosporangium sp. NPDC051539]|uniref:AAA family ATPase n=1 Tax=Cryptosporangium sp. NPDC051539 TaxID=3363962 RepID=UPI0037B83834
MTAGWSIPADPTALRTKLADVDYLADDGLAAAAFLALRMHRPLFLEGDPGVGKTDFAQRIADAFGVSCIRLQCHAGLDAAQALYDWNFPRQILAMRAAESTGEDRSQILNGLYTGEFLQRRPILEALQNSPAVLLIDEVDRADDEFEALLLQVLEKYTVSVPELDEPIEATTPPLTILTSNRTREVHDALKRRCLYHWITHPTPDQETDILHRRVRDLPEGLGRQIAERMVRVRGAENIVKTPGVAESIDFATALTAIGAVTLDESAVRTVVSTVVKHHDDLEQVFRLLAA